MINLKEWLVYFHEIDEKTIPSLVIVEYNSVQNILGFAKYDTNEIYINTWPNIKPSSLLTTLLHEVAHFIEYYHDNVIQYKTVHGDSFQNTFTDLINDKFGLDLHHIKSNLRLKDKVFERHLDNLLDNPNYLFMCNEKLLPLIEELI